ncbi:helicase C-terminal domain-containing protein [Pseudofulvimonas gallinarii]|uniref:helicase C-terminal domain-containing protein n=1 Tax=Pseudofulvimonas gallinarii TaxID=634155 RepID=UPI0035E81D65
MIRCCRRAWPPSATKAAIRSTTGRCPQAALALKQGVGRLIRSQDDRGVVALLDPRARGKSYGRRILAALPPMPVTDDAERVRAFFAPRDVE